MKTLKKSLSIILSMLLIFSTVTCLAISADAASGDVIYFEKPDDWGDTIYIYYWDASSQNPSWPGNAMTKVSGNIYSYNCPVGFSTFLINDGNGFQTGDLKHPGDGYIWKVEDTYTTNTYGNKCWDATASVYSLGLAVSASQSGGDFMNSISVKLSVSSATESYYTVNGGTKTAFANGDVIVLGEDAEVGDTITLVLTATDGKDTVTETYVYTKTDSPVASSIVYFDNSGFNWEEVYIYAYGTKENAEWPGELMQKDADGKYFYTLGAEFVSENIIVNNGKEKPDKEQYPENGGLAINKGECKLLTADNQWVDYGTPDGQPAGFAYTASGTSFKTDELNVKIGLKNAVKGTYQIDGGSVYEYTGDTTVAVGQGKISKREITLTLTATNASGVTTSKDYTYKRSFTKTETTFTSDSDGHTTAPISGKYGTNPNMQLGSKKTITVDGDPSDWDSSMIIAQGVANDDPRVYMPSSMHEQPWDDYALYAAWDEENLYFMWEMANTTYIVSPSDNFAASNEARPWRNSIPMYLALSVNPEVHADGTAWGTDAKTGAEFTNPFVWGCTGGVAKDGGINFTTNVDTLIAFDSNNSNGGASIFKADKYDEATDNYMFNYDTAIPIGVTSFEKQDNQNGFKIAHGNGTLSEEIIGVKQQKGNNKTGETFEEDSNWVDFKDFGYKDEYGYIYETAIPLEKLGIDRKYLETNGIGVMQILTYGTSGMDCLPYDPTMQDNANVEYSYDPSTSHEKEDIDNITVPLARVGALLKDTVVNEAPLEVNFGTDKAGAQGVGSNITLMAEAYNGSGNYNYEFKVNGTTVSNSSNAEYQWTPTEKGTYTISCVLTDKSTNNTASSTRQIIIGDEPVPVTTPPTQATQPTTDKTEPTSQTQPTTKETESTAPTESTTEETESTAQTQSTTEQTEQTVAPTQPTTDAPEPTLPTQPTTNAPVPTLPTQATTEPTNTFTQVTVPTEITPGLTYDYYVVGSPELLGADWAKSDTNGMTKEGDLYYLTIKNAKAGTYEFKVVDSSDKWHPDGMDNNSKIIVPFDGLDIVFCFDPAKDYPIAEIGVKPTYPTDPQPTETEPTEVTMPTECSHANTKTVGEKTATYFAKGYTGNKVCADCGEVVAYSRTVAMKVLKTPKVTVKGAKKAIKVTYKKVKDAKGFKVTYKLGKKTYTKKFTLSKKELKKAKVTKTIKVKKAGKYKVTVKAFTTSGKKIAYSKATSTKIAKVK